MHIAPAWFQWQDILRQPLMLAQDIMTKDVLTVTPDTSVKDIARCMMEHRVGGLPVIDKQGHIVGIVTEGDLVRRSDLDTARQRNGWLDIFLSNADRARDFAREHGRTAQDIMTTEVIAVAPGASLRQIADLFETRRIRRVPVVANGKVVGIVSRANLVQALATPHTDAVDRIDDPQIRDLVLAAYRRLAWGIRHERNIIVRDGVVHLWGFVPTSAELDALRVATEDIPGVKGFVDHTVRTFGEFGAWLRQRPNVTVIEPEDSS
jgi:CBS domain-containing protein